MNTYEITEQEKEALDTFFTKETLDNIGMNGFYTMAAADDEDFIAGVMQFYIGENAVDEVTAEITYLYVDPEFREQGAASVLFADFKDCIQSADIFDVTCELDHSKHKDLALFLENEGFKGHELSRDKSLYELKIPAPSDEDDIDEGDTNEEVMPE